MTDTEHLVALLSAHALLRDNPSLTAALKRIAFTEAANLYLRATSNPLSEMVTTMAAAFPDAPDVTSKTADAAPAGGSPRSRRAASAAANQ